MTKSFSVFPTPLRLDRRRQEGTQRERGGLGRIGAGGTPALGTSWSAHHAFFQFQRGSVTVRREVLHQLLCTDLSTGRVGLAASIGSQHVCYSAVTMIDDSVHVADSEVGARCRTSAWARGLSQFSCQRKWDCPLCRDSGRGASTKSTKGAKRRQWQSVATTGWFPVRRPAGRPMPAQGLGMPKSDGTARARAGCDPEHSVYLAEQRGGFKRGFWATFGNQRLSSKSSAPLYSIYPSSLEYLAAGDRQ